MVKFLLMADPGKWCQFPGITAKVKYLSPELEKIEMRSVFYSWILNWGTSPLLCRAPVECDGKQINATDGKLLYNNGPSIISSRLNHCPRSEQLFFSKIKRFDPSRQRWLL